VHGYGHNPLILPYIFQANTSTDNAQDQQWLSHPQGELVNALDNQKMMEGRPFPTCIPPLLLLPSFLESPLQITPLSIPISTDILMTKEHLVLLHWLSLLLPQAICAVVNDDSHVSSDTLATCGHRPYQKLFED